MIINVDSMICDMVKENKFKIFSGELFKCCLYYNKKTGLKSKLKHKKNKMLPNQIEGIIIYQKNMFNALILRKICWFQ